MCYGADILATVEEAEEDQDLNDIEDFVAFTIKSLEGYAILDGGATKTVSRFMSVQPAVDQYEETAIERTDVDFTFLMAVKRKRQARTSGYRTPTSRNEFQWMSCQTSRHLFSSVWM